MQPSSKSNKSHHQTTNKRPVPTGMQGLILRFIAGRPYTALGISFILLMGLASGLPKITADFTHRGFFYADDPLLVSFDEFERRFGNDDTMVVAMHSPSGIFDIPSTTTLIKLTEELWQVPEVIRVDSLANFSWIRAEGDELFIDPLLPEELKDLTPALLKERRAIALAHETLPDYMISKDGKTAMLYARIKPGIEAPPNAEIITKAVLNLTQKYSQGDHTFYVTGGPAMTWAFTETSITDMETLIPFVVLIVIILLALILRSVMGVMLGLGVVLAAILGAMGFAGHVGFQINNITSATPSILIAIGIADGIHILVTFFRALAQGHNRHDAASYALDKNFLPTFITSLTTSVGFLSFSTASLKPISHLGMMAGVGTIIAWVFTYFMLGALLYILPLRSRLLSEEELARYNHFISRSVTLIARYRKKIMLAFALLCVAAFTLLMQNEVNSDPMKYFIEGYPMRVANEFIEQEVGGARGVEIVIYGDATDGNSEDSIKEPALLKKAEKLQNWLESNPQITRVVSVIDIIRQLNRALHGGDEAYYKMPTDRATIGQELFLYTLSLPPGINLNDRLTIKNDAMRMTVLWTFASSAESVAMIKVIEDKAKEIGLNLEVTGKNRLYQSMNGYVVRSFLISISAAIILISIILITFFRSFALGMLAMIPNIIPLICGGAALYLLGQPLDIGTMIVASVCLGIAVDDTIHILANFREQRQLGMSRIAAVHEVLANTVPALLTTTVVLVCSFGTFVFGTFTPNLYFGLMTAVILTIALITDVTFLPALLIGKEVIGKERNNN